MGIKSFAEYKKSIEKIHPKAITIRLINHGGYYMSYKSNFPTIK